jgi:hypothetical protein
LKLSARNSLELEKYDGAASRFTLRAGDDG